MFDGNLKSCAKRIRLITDDCLYDRKPLYKVRILFIHAL